MAASMATLTRSDLQNDLNDLQGTLTRAVQDALLKQQRDIVKQVEELLASKGHRLPPLGINAVEEHDMKGMTSMSSTASTSLLRKAPKTVVPETPVKKSVWMPSKKYEIDMLPAQTYEIEVGPVRTTSSNLPQRSSTYMAMPITSQITDLDMSGKHSSEIYQHANRDSEHIGYVKWFVQSAAFEQGSGIAVLLNAISLGYDTEYSATHRDAAGSAITRVTEPLFCIVFTLEWLLRVAAFRGKFFTMEGARWNYFDTMLVMSQVLEQGLLLLDTTNSHLVNLSILRLMRLLRVIRTARLLRAFHLFDDLRVIVSSIGMSVSSLGWSLVLLLMLIYVFSLVFLQTIVSAGETEHYEQIHYWFSSLFRTFLTMFECVVGGVSWDEVVSPIVTDISPILGCIFCVYIAACLFAMMNLLTGVFVDKAMQSVREDKDVVLAKRIRDLFLTRQWNEDDSTIEEEVTWEIFEHKLASPAMKDYFTQMNVELSDARVLFDLMDVDGSGRLTSKDIIQSCLRLRGPARSLDLSLLAKEVSDLRTDVRDIWTRQVDVLSSLQVLGTRQVS